MCGQRQAPANLPPEKSTGRQRAKGWVSPKVVSDGSGKKTISKSLAHTRVRPPNHPARSESVYRRPYRGSTSKLIYTYVDILGYAVVQLVEALIFH